MCYVSLVNENCFEYLKGLGSESVSMVLIDPPYEVSRDTNFASGKPTGRNTDRFRVSMDFGDWDAGFTGLGDVIKELYRVLRKGGSLVCFYDLWKITILKEYFEAAKFKQIRFIEWIKTNPVPLNSKTNYLTNAREIGVVGVKGGKPVFHSEYDNGVYSYPICHDKGRFYPTQKPVALLEEIIEKHSNEGDLILDCFAGSASTAVAAYNLNRDFIGCEISEEYYDKAVERIRGLGIKLSSENNTCKKCEFRQKHPTMFNTSLCLNEDSEHYGSFIDERHPDYENKNEECCSIKSLA